MVFTEQDAVCLRAAAGWLQLGNWCEANDELENVTAALRAHPDVLTLRWRVFSMAGKWDGAFEIAKALTKLRPDDEYGWLCRAASQHAIGETYVAYQELVAFFHEFPECSAAIPYRAACYATRRQNAMASFVDRGRDMPATVAPAAKLI